MTDRARPRPVQESLPFPEPSRVVWMPQAVRWWRGEKRRPVIVVTDPQGRIL